MELEQEILAIIEAAKAWNKDADLSDFQFMATEDGSLLINLKTGQTQFIHDDESELLDLVQFLGRDSCPAASLPPPMGKQRFRLVKASNS